MARLVSASCQGSRFMRTRLPLTWGPEQWHMASRGPADLVQKSVRMKVRAAGTHPDLLCHLSVGPVLL